MLQRFVYSPWRRGVRLLWTLLTLVLVLPLLLVAAAVGVVIGLVRGLLARTPAWYTFRSVLLNAVLRVLGPWLRFSTRLYNGLFGKELYDRFPLPAPTHAFYVVGHRGSPSRCCENTLHSYAQALREGANALEIDLCFTKDGEVVIWHDWDPDSMVALFRESGEELLQRYRPVYGKPPFRKPAPYLTLEELRTHCCFELREGGAPDPPELLQIPTYGEFLAWAAQQKGLKRVFLDMKIPPDGLQYVAPMVGKMIADYDAICPNFEVVFMTIYPEILARMKALFPEQNYCYDKEITNTFAVISREMIEAHSPILEARRLGHKVGSVGRPTFLMLGPWEVYESVVQHDLELRHAERLDIELISWTVNDAMEQRWLIDAGVDGILTDDPRGLANIVLKRKIVQTAKCPVRMLRSRGRAVV